MAEEGQNIDSTAERQVFIDSVLQGAKENAEASIVSNVVPTTIERFIPSFEIPGERQPFVTIVREEDGQKIRVEDRTSYDPKGLLTAVLNGRFTEVGAKKDAVYFIYMKEAPWGSSIKEPKIADFVVSIDQATNIFLLSGRALGFGREELEEVCSSYYEKGDFSKWPEHLVQRRFLPTLRAKLHEAASETKANLVEETTEPVILRRENTVLINTLDRLQVENVATRAKAEQLETNLGETSLEVMSLRQETRTLTDKLASVQNELEAAKRDLEAEKQRANTGTEGANTMGIEQLINGLDKVSALKILTALKRSLLGGLHPERFQDDPKLGAAAQEFYKNVLYPELDRAAKSKGIKLK